MEAQWDIMLCGREPRVCLRHITEGLRAIKLCDADLILRGWDKVLRDWEPPLAQADIMLFFEDLIKAQDEA